MPHQGHLESEEESGLWVLGLRKVRLVPNPSPGAMTCYPTTCKWQPHPLESKTLRELSLLGTCHPTRPSESSGTEAIRIFLDARAALGDTGSQAQALSEMKFCGSHLTGCGTDSTALVCAHSPAEELMSFLGIMLMPPSFKAGQKRQPLSVLRSDYSPSKGEGRIQALGLQQPFLIPLLSAQICLCPSLDQDHLEVSFNPAVPTMPSARRHRQHCQGRRSSCFSVSDSCRNT